MPSRKLSRGAQAARNNNYGTLANFRHISKAPGGAYARGAMLYAKTHGLKNVRSTFAPTSKYARLYGKAFFNKDGTERKKPHKTYQKVIEKGTGIAFSGPNQVMY